MKQEVEKTVCKIIVMANQKGGVAKTSSTRNLAYSLAEMGQRVLAVDFDPQTNLTISFGSGTGQATGDCSNGKRHTSSR